MEKCDLSFLAEFELLPMKWVVKIQTKEDEGTLHFAWLKQYFQLYDFYLLNKITWLVKILTFYINSFLSVKAKYQQHRKKA
jgi:hypothetical protein